MKNYCLHSSQCEKGDVCASRLANRGPRPKCFREKPDETFAESPAQGKLFEDETP